MVKKRIVIIENDHLLLEAMEYLLTEEGYTVIAVPDESDLFHLDTMPDLILLDHWLNDRTGHDICIALKQNVVTAAIPVILTSAVHGLQDIAESCKADAYIAKPFDIFELKALVKKHLVFIP